MPFCKLMRRTGDHAPVVVSLFRQDHATLQWECPDSLLDSMSLLTIPFHVFTLSLFETLSEIHFLLTHSPGKGWKLSYFSQVKVSLSHCYYILRWYIRLFVPIFSLKSLIKEKKKALILLLLPLIRDILQVHICQGGGHHRGGTERCCFFQNNSSQIG